MSCLVHNESAAAFAARRPYSWRALFDRLTLFLRTCRERQRQRQELLDFMASDHRAAADIGMTPYEARKWAERPFWRA